ncbi:MAG TPA: SRPBCC family protein [Gemmatimonadales bacterium]|nr:SRPBCC family protein [Gemmatimonadales bacterium]
MGARDFLGGALVGAGLVYFLDAERGPERRARMRDRLGRSSVSARYGSRLGDIDGLEAANLARGGLAGAGMERLARIAGGALVAYGLLRRGATGSLLRTLGAGMVATGLKQPGAPGRAPGGERRRTVDIQKTLHVDAPVEQVYAFWSSYDNFPLFMSNVREVRDLGAQRSSWVVSGPGGVPVEWTAVLTEREENRLLAWRSEPGSVLENAGVIRFAREAGGTRIDLRFCYSPPAGSGGRALGEFFGADPRIRVNEDLARLKALLESTVRSDSHDEERRP